MNKISIVSLVYIFLTICSLVFLYIYKAFYKESFHSKYFYSFIAVILIDVGHLLMSLSRNLKLALWANRLIYFGTIFLITLFIYITSELCGIHFNKIITLIIHLVTTLMVLLTTSAGTSIKLYYQEVTFSCVNNIGHLHKIYGPLHNLYSIYVVLVMLILMVIVGRSVIGKKVISGINPSILTILVLENVFVWFVERYVDVDLELLTISYFLGEITLLLVFRNIEQVDEITKEVNLVKQNTDKKTVEEVVKNWTAEYSLTEREVEVLKLLLDNVPRNEIGNSLFISEHTVKKHTAHIYEKMAIESRNELLYKLNEELTKRDYD